VRLATGETVRIDLHLENGAFTEEDVIVRGTAVLELRGEVFNATNTPALGAPNTTVGAAAFGTIATAGEPRGLQLAVKLVF
jgi:hypothetical protein